jgi:hypothetical protein
LLTRDQPALLEGLQKSAAIHVQMGQAAQSQDLAAVLYSSALEFDRHALLLARIVGDSAAEAAVLRAIGRTLDALGAVDEAQQFLAAARDLYATLVQAEALREAEADVTERDS